MSGYLLPVNICGSSAWGGVFFSREQERDIMLRRDGEESFNETIHECVLQWLKHGFAVPNASIAWSILFSGLEDEHYRHLYGLPGFRPDWAGEEETFETFDQAEQQTYRRDRLRVHLFERAVWCASPNDGWHRQWTDRERVYCRGLPIVNVGMEKSRAYVSLASACTSLIEDQLGGKADLRALANPAALKSNLHAYIDRLVFLSNEVQHYCGYIREAPCAWDVSRAHEEALSDAEIESIARTAPAVMFTQALAGAALAPMPRTGRSLELCPV